ncbi:MAG: hypothetical protein ISR35_04640 [Planctomycetes bacterium]|nr:hypothetical protein [Planctomycetota bacterium]
MPQQTKLHSQRLQSSILALIFIHCAGLSSLYADFEYLDFTNMAGLTMVGSSSQVVNRVRLTPSALSQVGALYTTDRIPVSEGFDTTFTYQINPITGGADGMTFLIQSESPTALYNNGGPLGYSGMTNSLAIEIDCYSNGNWNDPPGHHLAIHGVLGAPNSADELIGGLAIDTAIGNVAGVRTMRVYYDSVSLQVFIDDLTTPRLSLDINLFDYIGSDEAWVGFTGSTGGITQINDLLSWTFINEGSTSLTRGDLNLDGSVNLPDAIFGLSSLFVPGSPAPACQDSADINDDGSFNLPDAIFLLSALFVPNSTPIPEPSNCGTDNTDDGLDCAETSCP